MNRWLFKTEPSSYAWNDLVRERRARWDGVANALALKHLRAVRNGDAVLVYHTGDEKAAIGVAEAISDPYPDPAAADARLVVVDLAPGRALARPVTLREMRAVTALSDFDLLRLPRLSVVPVAAEHWRAILDLSRGPRVP